MSGTEEELDCGKGGREAAVAATTGEGKIGGSELAEEFTFSGTGATGGSDREDGSVVLCKDGSNSAHKPSNAALKIPARMRRRSTRSSRDGQLPCGCKCWNEFYRETHGKKAKSFGESGTFLPQCRMNQ